MSERRNKYGETEWEFRSKVASFGSQDRLVRMSVKDEVPESLNKITDAVLSYHPKSKKTKKRKKVKK